MYPTMHHVNKQSSTLLCLELLFAVGIQPGHEEK